MTKTLRENPSAFDFNFDEKEPEPKKVVRESRFIGKMKLHNEKRELE